MSKLDFLALDTELNKLFENLISEDFIKAVHKWACYDGEHISLCHVSLENKGIIEYKYLTEKIDVIYEGNVFKGVEISEEKTEETSDIYDASIIRHSSRCTDYDAMLLLSERDKYNSGKINVKIFIISEDDNEDGIFPTFNNIKTKIEQDQYTGESLVREFCGTYQLIAPCNYDRILCYTAIYSDLEELELYIENGNEEL